MSGVSTHKPRHSNPIANSNHKSFSHESFEMMEVSRAVQGRGANGTESAFSTRSAQILAFPMMVCIGTRLPS